MERDRSIRRYERLKGSLRFKIIREESRPLKGKWLLINISPNGLSFNRIGISISSKAQPKNAKRNRLKRLIREAYRLHKTELKKGFDIVVRVKKIKKIEVLSFRETEKDLLAIFEKGRILG